MDSEERSRPEPAPGGAPDQPGPAAGRRRSLVDAEARSHRILMTVLRSIFVVVLITVVVLTVASNRTSALDFGFSTVVGLLIAAVALGLLVITVDALTPNKRLAWVVAIFVGTMLGLVGAVGVGSVIDLVAGAWDLRESAAVYLGLGKVTIGIILVYLSVSVVLTTRDDFRLVIPYVEFARQVRGARPLLLDTSALIDGRFDDLARTGIVDAPVIVARFVVDELQALADSGDRLKRERGRRGLEVLQRLQGNPWIDLQVEDLRTEERSVDRALVEVAKADRCRIVTTDTGLERVAQINGVACLNLNAVAGAMRSGLSAGEELRLAIVKRGESPHQGVGFLADGAMVVVDHGADAVGSTVSVSVTNTVQTSAGRLVFARIAPREGDAERATEGATPADAAHGGTTGAGTADGAADEPGHADAGAADAPGAAGSRTSGVAHAATHQPRTPPRTGQEPRDSRNRRNPRR
jgi:uncharacterized protein YacL